MTEADFENVLQRRLRLIQEILAAKGMEYASGEVDRLQAFKIGAALIDATPEMVCIGYLTKHLVSILDLVRDKASGFLDRLHLVDEKIGDAINYLILLEALFVEKR